jgi:hypothetical protein
MTRRRGAATTMQRTATAVAVLAAGAALTIAAAAPAEAKGGPEGVSIARPGGEPVELVRPDDEPGVEEGWEQLGMLTEDLGLWETAGDGAALLADAPTNDLGVALTVEWTMYNPVPANPDAAPKVVQRLYPHAAGGPLVYTPGGQRIFGLEVTKPGWFRAPERLAPSLGAYGVEFVDNDVRLPDPTPAAAPKRAAARPQPATATATGRTGADPLSPLAIAGMTGAAVIVAGAGTLVVRRTRARRGERVAAVQL